MGVMWGLDLYHYSYLFMVSSEKIKLTDYLNHYINIDSYTPIASEVKKAEIA